MRPRNKFEKEIVRLSKLLRPLTKPQLNWINNEAFEHYAYVKKHTTECLDCNHIWNNNGDLICPICKHKLIPLRGKTRTTYFDDYISIITIIKNYQVIRYFYIRKYCKSRYKPKTFISEVVQHWIRHDGKHRLLAKRRYNTFYSNSWCYWDNLEIRELYDKYFIINDNTYPRKRYLPILYRNGFKNEYYDISKPLLISYLLSKPMAEILIKNNQTNILPYVDDDRVIKYWPSIRICIRHKYIIEDVIAWFDHMYSLEFLGMDISNPKYICPENFNELHSKLSERVSVIKARKQYEKQKEKIKNENIKYYEKKKRYLNITISNENITISPLKNIEEFLIEGEALHHCVFSNNYYNNDESLILSAKHNDKRIETIELSLKTLEIIQSRGLFNKSSPYHDEIIDLLNNNINVIKKAKRTKQLSK